MAHLFFRDTDPAQTRILSRPTMLTIGLLFGPMALLLTLLRLIEHSLLRNTGALTVGTVLWESAAPLFFLLFLTVTLGWWALRSWPHVQPAWIMAGTVILGLGLVLWAAILMPPWISGWITPSAFQVVRGDLLALVMLALGFTLWLELSAGWAHRLGLTVLHLVLPPLLLLPILELGVIQTMGLPLDASLLAYTIRHMGELAPVLASEVGPADAALLLVPLAVTLGPLAVRSLPPVRRWMRDAPAAAPRRAWHAVLVALPLLLVLLLPPATALPPTHRTASFAGMIDSMLGDRPFEPDGFANLAAADDPPFATRDLRLVPTDQTRRMNVVVIILESARSRSVTPYNPFLATTPFLDDLARRSLLVEKMYGIISYTNKALVPILGGVYPELGREIVEARPGGVPAAGLPILLRPHGYRTAFFTPATMTFEDKDQILRNLGFDDIYGDAAYDKTGFHQVNYFGYQEHVMLEPSMAWVDDVTARDQPFFLSYLTLTPHHPYETPSTIEKKPFDTADPRYNDYLNALHYNDVFLKDLFGAFEQRGLIDSTLFVILGDHGEAFDEHGQSMHGDIIWDEAIQVPALLYNPVLFPEGGRISGNRSQIDVMPTIAAALGYRLEGGLVPGLSLLGPVPDARPVYHSARDGNQLLALRQDSLKFFYYNRRQPMQVFDTRNDPLERRDIAREIDPNLLKTVELKLLLWRRGVQQQYHLSASASDTHAASSPAPDRRVAAIHP